MVNPRFLELAKRLGNKDLPKEKTPKEKSKIIIPSMKLSKIAEDPFILTYDQFGKELITKSNELFSGTQAEIPTENLGDGEEIPNIYMLKRLALITAMYMNPQLRLRRANAWPITPEQSELLLKEGKLPTPEKNWEDLALILYDRSEDGENPAEAKAIYESLKKHRKDLGLSESDLESKLIIVNAGLEVDNDMQYNVKPIVLPGLTQIDMHPVLEKVGKDYSFEYGLENGLPAEKELGKGDRTLYMPDETEDIGLRVLFRNEDLDLGAGDGNLVSSSSDGRVNFARQGVAK